MFNTKASLVHPIPSSDVDNCTHVSGSSRLRGKYINWVPNSCLEPETSSRSQNLPTIARFVFGRPVHMPLVSDSTAFKSVLCRFLH